MTTHDLEEDGREDASAPAPSPAPSSNKSIHVPGIIVEHGLRDSARTREQIAANPHSQQSSSVSNRASGPSFGAKDTFRDAYAREYANTRRWGLSLIWVLAALWVAGLVGWAISLPASMSSVPQTDSQRIAAVLLTFASLVGTFAVMFLFVNQRELIHRRADVAGREAGLTARRLERDILKQTAAQERGPSLSA